MAGLRVLAVVALFSLTALAPQPQATGAGVGFADLRYGDAAEAPTAQGPESKLWWNDGAWWGSLYSEAVGLQHIFRLDPESQQWVDTEVTIDDRPETRADVLWDGRRLYVLSHVASPKTKVTPDPADWARLYRFSYDRRNRRYALDAGFPAHVAQVRAESMVLAKDSTGQLWVTYVLDGKVMLNRTQGSDLIWGAPFALPASGSTVSEDDQAALVSFGANKIGVMWTNQVENALYFAAHLDCSPDEAWGETETALKAPGFVDDHLDVKSIRLDGRGWVYAAAKTARGGGGAATLIWFVSRAPAGQWQAASFGIVLNGHSEPLILLDSDHRQAYVFATAPVDVTNSAIFYKVASLPGPRFVPGVGLAGILLPDLLHLDHPTSTKQNLSAATGLVVLAGDDTAQSYAHSFMGIEPVEVSATATATAAGISECYLR